MRVSSAVENVSAEQPAPTLPARYEVRRVAGAGTFGTVWQVADGWTGNVRAAKVLSAQHQTPDWHERFYHEFALLYRLAHPSLVHAYDFGRTQEQTPYFTMDWIEAPTLAEGTWQIEERLRIVWELLDVLAFLHREGIIHADIKAANVKVDREALGSTLDPAAGRAVTLLDFGLTLDARVRGEEHRRGTVHYMAPEWFKDEPIDFRIDYYSLGVLLFEMWAGRLPFDGAEPLAVIRQHLEVVPPELGAVAPDVPSQIAEGVARLLAKQPEIRDRGWELLKHFAAQRFGAEPGSGPAALRFHRASLGTCREQLPDQVVDNWLGHAPDVKPLVLRGGIGLDQHDILRSLAPDVCRAGMIPWIVTDLAAPLPPGESFESAPATFLPLLAVDPASSEAAFTFYRRWHLQGPNRPLALSVDADDGRNRELVAHLAEYARRDECYLHVVREVDVELSERRMRQVLARPLLEAERRPLLDLAAGNPARLWGLLEDRLAGLPTAADHTALPPDSRYRRRIEQELENLRRTWSAEEQAAMSLLAAARTSVDRSVLRALADADWTRALGRWLDCGLVEGRAGTFAWTRPDLAGTILGMLPERRRRIIHRAWAEYWGSRKPEVGSPEHEHLVYHLLRSDAYRQATRVGLEHARYCTTQHQAKRALEILDFVARAMAQVPHPAPSLTFELAIAHAEARRVLARYGEALEQLDLALRNDAIRGNVRWEAEIFKRKGDLCKSLKQSAAGKEALEEALTRFRQLDDQVEVSHVLNNIGNIHYVAGEFDLALAAYDEALALQRQLGLRREVASTLNNMGGLSVLRSRYDVATEHLTEAVAIKRTLDDPEELARSLNNLAVAHMETGKYGLAVEVLTESYRINTDAGKSGELLFNLENLAAVALARGEWTEAMTHCERGLKLCEQAGEAEGRLPFLLVMSGTALAQGNYDLIPVAVGEAGQILQRIEDSDAHLGARLLEADWACWLNQADRALRKATEVLARAEAEALPAWTTRGSIVRARIARMAGEHPSTVRPWLEAALQLARETGVLPEQIRAHTLLAEADVEEARIEAAAEHLRRCEQLLLECSAKPLFLPFSHALGHYYARRGEREMALSALDTARKLATNLTQVEWIWRFYALCGHQLVALKRYDGAVDQYRSGLVLLEHLAAKIPAGERERYMQGSEKIALAEGLRTCHEALVR